MTNYMYSYMLGFHVATIRTRSPDSIGMPRTMSIFSRLNLLLFHAMITISVLSVTVI